MFLGIEISVLQSGYAGNFREILLALFAFDAADPRAVNELSEEQKRAWQVAIGKSFNHRDPGQGSRVDIFKRIIRDLQFA